METYKQKFDLTELPEVHDLFDHIQQVKDYALKEGIKANMIIISPSVAKVEGFSMAIPGSVSSLGVHNEIVSSPTMFMGLEVQYDERVKDYGANFIIAKKPEKQKVKSLEDYSTDELLEEIRRRMEQ